MDTKIAPSSRSSLPAKIEIPKAKQANREDGSPYQRNLFDVTTEDDLNQFENKVATYLDQHARLFSTSIHPPTGTFLFGPPS